MIGGRDNGEAEVGKPEVVRAPEKNACDYGRMG